MDNFFSEFMHSNKCFIGLAFILLFLARWHYEDAFGRH